MKFVFAGRMDYGLALGVQKQLHALRRLNAIEDAMLILEHDPVITLGRNAKPCHILASKEELDKNGVNVYETNRGGDVTYHGPGQLVGYPIMNLADHGKDIRSYVLRLEQIFINLLKQSYGIEAHREEKEYTGVWVGNKKITAIGIAVKHWITMHGFAFNVNTDLNHFNWIVPCGLSDRGVTSLKNILGREMDIYQVGKDVMQSFCEVFGAKPEILSLKELLAAGGVAEDDVWQTGMA